MIRGVHKRGQLNFSDCYPLSCQKLFIWEYQHFWVFLNPASSHPILPSYVNEVLWSKIYQIKCGTEIEFMPSRVDNRVTIHTLNFESPSSRTKWSQKFFVLVLISDNADLESHTLSPLFAVAQKQVTCENKLSVKKK